MSNIDKLFASFADLLFEIFILIRIYTAFFLMKLSILIAPKKIEQTVIKYLILKMQQRVE